MPKSGWVLVEALEATRLTVVARSNEPRSRTSFERAVQDPLGGSKGPGTEAARWLEASIAELRRQPAATSINHTLRNGQTVAARLIPVVGPDGVLHGVQVWIGADNESPSTPPMSAFAFTWDSHQRLADIPAALANGQPDTRLTAPEIFRFVEPVDAFALIKALLTHEPGSYWEGPVSMTFHKQQTPAQLLMVAGPTDETSHHWRGLIFQTTSASSGAPSLEAAALAAIPRMSQVHMALVDIAKMRLLRWITDPMSDVQWKGQVDQRDTPHPDDVKRIFEAATDVFTGKTETGFVEGIRLRRRGGGWVVTDGTGAIMRTSPDAPLLGVVQFRVTGYSDEPDPVEPTDQGHPGLSDPT